MADINLERKDATMWPWVVGLLALALVIWGVWAATDETNGDLAFDDPEGTTPPAAETMGEDWQQDETEGVPSSVRDFLNDCSVAMAPGAGTQQPGQTGDPQTGQEPQEPAGQEPTGQMTQEGQTQGEQQESPAEYAENCIDLMITAMDDMVEDDPQLDPELDRLRERADALGEEDSESPQYTTHVHEILTSAANLLEQVQQTRPAPQEAQTELQEVQRAADEIQADVPIAQQTEGLSRFFQRAGTAMQMMGE